RSCAGIIGLRTGDRGLCTWWRGFEPREHGLMDLEERLGRGRASALSVPSNIAEAFERGSRNESHPFLSVAKSSCAEVRSDLYTAMDIGYLEIGRVESLRTHSVLSQPLWRNWQTHGT